jgi:hypothetical protein
MLTRCAVQQGRSSLVPAITCLSPHSADNPATNTDLPDPPNCPAMWCTSAAHALCTVTVLHVGAVSPLWGTHTLVGRCVHHPSVDPPPPQRNSTQLVHRIMEDMWPRHTRYCVVTAAPCSVAGGAGCIYLSMITQSCAPCLPSSPLRCATHIIE